MATLATGGFTQPRVQLEPALVDPRILALDLSSLGRGASQGLQLAGAYGQLRDAAVARQQEEEFRPLVNEARRLQLEAAPQLLRNQLQAASIEATRARNTPIELGDEAFQAVEVPRIDPADGRAYATPDIMLQSTRTVIDPATGQTRTIKRVTKPIATIEQQALAEDLSNQRAENLRLAQERIEASTTAAAAAAAERERAAQAREQTARDRLEIDKQLADLRGQVEQRQARQAEARLGDADRAQALRELNALSRDKALIDYYNGTRDAQGNILREDAPGLFTGDRDVTLNPRMEDQLARVEQLQSLLYSTSGDLLEPAASTAPVPTVSYTPVGSSTTAALGAPVTAPAAIPAPVPATPVAPNIPLSNSAPSAQIPTLSPQQAASLPSGSFFYGTDGVLRRKP